MRVATFPRLKIVGETFGARGCASSCSCDPCDCNPCGCGDEQHEGPNYPAWRVNGYYIAIGEIKDLDVSNLTLLSLAQPVKEGDNQRWQEVLLVESRATREQVVALLAQFEGQLESMPAEVGTYAHTLRPVYQTPLAYVHRKDGLSLQVRFTPETATLIRKGAASSPIRDWSYDGPMALRETINDRQ